MIGIQIIGGGGNIVNGELIDTSNGKTVTIDQAGNKTVTNKDGEVICGNGYKFNRPRIKSSLYDKMVELGLDVSGIDKIGESK